MDKNTEKDAFVTIMETLYPCVLGIVKKFRFDECTCMDVAQEIVFKVYLELDSFNTESELRAWISTAARTYCIGYRKRIYKRYPVPVYFCRTGGETAIPGNGDAFMNAGLKKTLLRHLHKLPYNLKTAVVPYYLFDLKRSGPDDLFPPPPESPGLELDSSDNLLRN